MPTSLGKFSLISESYKQWIVNTTIAFVTKDIAIKMNLQL